MNDPLTLEPGGVVVTVPPEELAPYDRLGDGRFILSLHGSSIGWTHMEVAHVRAECEVVFSLDGYRACVWFPQPEESERIPIPRQLSVIRGARFPGYTCTSPGDPDLCASCPARETNDG